MLDGRDVLIAGVAEAILVLVLPPVWFEESSEQQSARSEMTPIEAKRELVKVALQMIGLDGAFCTYRTQMDTPFK